MTARNKTESETIHPPQTKTDAESLQPPATKDDAERRPHPGRTSARDTLNS